MPIKILYFDENHPDREKIILGVFSAEDPETDQKIEALISDHMWSRKRSFRPVSRFDYNIVEGNVGEPWHTLL